MKTEGWNSASFSRRSKDDPGNRLPQKAYVAAISVNGKEREGVKVVLAGAG
ncbi:MAG: hypothetical protein KKA81_09590 [Bacteroidetes bacterium]|nr:hypothetical protein [Bacteroidota bacterium]